MTMSILGVTDPRYRSSVLAKRASLGDRLRHADRASNYIKFDSVKTPRKSSCSREHTAWREQ